MARPSSPPKASISRAIVTGVLRGELGFNGVVTTDAMSMAGLLAVCPTAEGCARAIQAGNDLVLVKDCGEGPFEAFKAIKRYVETGKIPESQLAESVRRILAMKLRYGLFAHRYVRPAGADRAVRDPEVVRAGKLATRRCLTLVRAKGRVLPGAR